MDNRLYDLYLLRT